MLSRLKNAYADRSLSALVYGERSLLAAIAAVSGLVLVFLALADFVDDGETAAFDHWVLTLFRSPSNPDVLVGPLWVQEMVRDATSLGSFTFLGLLVACVAIYLFLSEHVAAAWLVLISVLSGTALSTILKMSYNRPRPDLVTTTHEFTASFPSGHAMLSAVTFLTLGALLARLAPTRRLRIFSVVAAIVLTLIVGLSRLYLGVHFPSDVLAGWCLGSAWALLCSAVFSRITVPHP